MSTWLLYSLMLTTLLTSLIEESHSDCRLMIVKSQNQVYGNYYSNGRWSCCSYTYPIIDSYALCTNVSLTANQQNLEEVMTYPNNSQMEPTSKFKNFSLLRFVDSHVPTIYSSLFNNLGSITQLYMNSTQVNEIQPAGFNGLSHLQVLHLGDNNLTKICRGTLNHLLNLSTLNMSNNQIHTIESHAFTGLISLRKLILSHNKLKVLLDYTFPYFKFIELIDLSHNIISNYSEMVFSNYSQYSSLALNSSFQLNLSFNKLTTLNTTDLPQTISNLNMDNNEITEFFVYNFDRLTIFSLNNNKISNFTVPGKILTYLGLRNNKILDLDVSVFQDSETLVTLDLSQNLIRALHEDVFGNLKNLSELFLNNNKLDYIPIGCFRKLSVLKTLNISGNRITKFEFGTFSGLDNLITLDISDNSLTHLYESTLYPLQLLENLFLDRNFITVLDPVDISQLLKSLKRISLNFNPWDCKSLLNIFFQMNHNNVVVFKGFDQKVINVYGVACNDNTNHIFDNPTASSASNDINKEIDLKVFNNFFNKEFFNTAFYRYFKNYADIHVQEKTFLNNFEKTFRNILNDPKNESSYSTLSQQLNTAISNFITEFEIISEKNSNFSAQDNKQLKAQIANYFNSEFENSSFYKYFNKDWNNDSNFASVFTKLNALKALLNVNTSDEPFSKYSQHDKIDGDFPKSEKLLNNDDHVVTLSDLQNSVNGLLIVIIAILCLSFVLFVIKSFNDPISKFLNRKNDKSVDSQVNVQLL